MNLTYIACAALLVLGASRTGAEVGDRFEESVQKHGTPIGKMVRNNQTVYVFQIEGNLAREVYDENDRCVESDFTTPPPTPAETVEPAPEPAPAPIPVPEEKATVLWPYLLLLPLIGIGGLLLFFVISRKKSARENLDTDSKTTDRSKDLCEQEASLRLSRNEMCFLKALQKAVIDEYNVTFHIDLNRIIDIHDSSFLPHASTYNSMEPLLVDFVLHNTDDSSIAAVVVLCDPKAQSDQRTRKAEFLKKALEAQGIQLIKINENYQYDPVLIKSSLQVLKSTHLSAA
jgi:hypothetical protein